jgi:uncharacterized protein YjbI with pentapeptide repeats
MEQRLHSFLQEAFTPYGEFPARNDVMRELETNLQEKYADYKQQGLSDEEAYDRTIESFGDVSEIMEQVPHKAATGSTSRKDTGDDGRGFHKMFRDVMKQAKKSRSKFSSSVLNGADLSDTALVEADFSFSSMTGAMFDGSNLMRAKFRASALREASFAGADLTEATFAGSDLTRANFNNANLTNASFKGSALKGARVGWHSTATPWSGWRLAAHR